MMGSVPERIRTRTLDGAHAAHESAKVVKQGERDKNRAETLFCTRYASRSVGDSRLYLGAHGALQHLTKAVKECSRSERRVE